MKKALTYIEKFIYSPYFLFSIGTIVLLSWAFDLSAIGIALLLAISGFILFISRDVIPPMACLSFCIYCTSKPDILDKPETLIPMVIGAIIFIAGIIGHLFIYPPKKFKLFKLTIPLILVSIALFIGGIGVIDSKSYFNSMTFILTLGVLLLALYYFIMLYTCPKDFVDIKRYTCFILFFLGLVLICQAFIHLIRMQPPNIDHIMRAEFNVGWGNRNGIALSLTLMIPAAFYLAYTSKHLAILYYIVPFIQHIGVFLMFSRAGLIIITIEMVVSIIYTFIKGSNKSHLVYTIGIIGILIAIFMLKNSEIVMQMIEIIDTHFDGTTSKRDLLYKEAMQVFLEHPLFGAGVGYIGSIFSVAPHCMYWFHNTILQVMANMGIIGLICYVIFYVARGVIMFSNPKQFNMILSIALVMFEIYCLAENATFIPFPNMYIVILITAIMEYNNGKEATSISAININIH